jgi:hypothetical protein
MWHTMIAMSQVLVPATWMAGLVISQQLAHVQQYATCVQQEAASAAADNRSAAGISAKHAQEPC